MRSPGRHNQSGRSRLLMAAVVLGLALTLLVFYPPHWAVQPELRGSVFAADGRTRMPYCLIIFKAALVCKPDSLNLLTCDDAKFLRNEYTLSDGNGEFVFPRIAVFHHGTGTLIWRGEYLGIGLETAFCEKQHYEGNFLPRLDLSNPNNVRIVMRAEDDGGSNISRLHHRLLQSPEAIQVRSEDWPQFLKMLEIAYANADSISWSGEVGLRDLELYIRAHMDPGAAGP